MLIAITTVGCASAFEQSETPAAKAIYVNDAQTDGNRFCPAPGSDDDGDGSVQRPFATLRRALGGAKPGDTIFIDSGSYDVNEGILIGVDYLRIRGAGARQTRLRVESGGDTSALVVKANGVQVSDLSISGGRIGIELRANSTILRRVAVHSQDTYGILLQDSQGSIVHDCRIWATGFRGMEITGGRGNFVSNCWSSGNRNAGFCLSSTEGNVLTRNTADRNLTSGFFITGDSLNNALIENVSYRSGLGGFYLYDGSHGNLLENNVANWNQRGFVLKHAMANRLTDNSATGNQYAEFQIRGDSRDNLMESNTGEVELLPGE